MEVRIINIFLVKNYIYLSMFDEIFFKSIYEGLLIIVFLNLFKYVMFLVFPLDIITRSISNECEVVLGTTSDLKNL